MAVGYNPRAITDGLVLALDAQNSKSWKSGTTWTDTFGGNNGTLTGGISHSDGPFPEAGYVEFDGSTEYLSIADSADLRLGTGTFTIEAWIYPHTVSPTYNSSIVVKGSSSAATTWQFDISNTSKLRFQYDASSSFSSSSSLVANVWTHVAVVREGTGTNETKLYINGVLDTTGTVASDFSTTDTMKIGRNRGGGTVTYYNGYISNLRIIKGTALYTSNFTPPSSPLTAVTNTTLLCCQGGTNVDASPSAHSFQVIIGVPTLTSVGPSATKYFEFDGSNDYILLDSGLGIGTDDFAISVWVKFDSVSGVSGSANYRTVLSSYSGGNGYIFGLWISGDPVFEHYMDGTSYKGNTTIVADTWYNMVSTRLSGDLYLYLNGSLDNTPVSASTKDMADTATPRIGWIPSASQNGRLDGTVSDLKIYKGKGLTAAEVTQNYNATKGRYA